MKNSPQTIVSPVFIVILFAFSFSGCAEILADIACSAGADYVHIGRMVVERPMDSPHSRARCEMDPNCACLRDGRCFGETVAGGSHPWWSKAGWWDEQSSGSYSTIQCKSEKCDRLMDFRRPDPKSSVPFGVQPLPR